MNTSSITTDKIRLGVKKLYSSNSGIHLNINMTHPKVQLNNISATIKGVYPHFFMVEESENPEHPSHTLTYSDVLTGLIEIKELPIQRR